MTQARPAPLLDLATLIERPRIAIDGTLYEILCPEELSVIDSARFSRWGQRIEALHSEEGEAAEAELAELVDTAARRICVGVPDEIFAKLPPLQRRAVIEVFTGLLLRRSLMVAGAIAAATGELPEFLTRPTGASSSPASSDFTAATRATGWRRFLPRWFALT